MSAEKNQRFRHYNSLHFPFASRPLGPGNFQCTCNVCPEANATWKKPIEAQMSMSRHIITQSPCGAHDSILICSRPISVLAVMGRASYKR